MKAVKTIEMDYAAAMGRQEFNRDELDYSIVERHKLILQQLAKVGNSGITVFDLYLREHVFTSYNFARLLGYDVKEMEKPASDYLNSRVHPEDTVSLMRNGVVLLNFIFNAPLEEKLAYKLINEYRILNQDGRYIRVIEQHQALELDKRGNIWLALSVLDISPNQESYRGIKSQLLHFKTGKLFPLVSLTSPKGGIEDRKLTKKELEILHLVKDGFLSKEISDRLSISIHTVNTHRQRILEKLGVSNSIEAVNFASTLGLLT